jgi:glycosyltransferase involved in cell wall biosynthesis
MNVRVLLLTDANVFAGTERHILTLACALHRKGIDVRIGCPSPSPLAEQAAQGGVGVIAIPKRGRIDWRCARLLRRMVRKGEFDLIHAHNGRTALAATIALRGLKRGRLIVTQHFLQPAHTKRQGLAGKLSRMIHRRIAARNSCFIAISQAVDSAMRQRQPISTDCIAVVPNGLEPLNGTPLRPAIQVRAELNIDAQAPLIVCAARLQREKDIPSLLLAMKQVSARFPQARCVIAGDGSQEAALRRQIDELGLQAQVQLLGFRHDVLDLIHAGDLFVLPSLAEPFGLVLLEAMSLAKAVVATNAGGPAEIVENGKTGLLVPPSSPSALADAIASLLQDSGRRTEMGRAGLARFVSHFTADRMATDILNIYRQALAE